MSYESLYIYTHTHAASASVQSRTSLVVVCFKPGRLCFCVTRRLAPPVFDACHLLLCVVRSQLCPGPRLPLRSALGQARPAGAEETQRSVHGEYRRSRRGSGQLADRDIAFFVVRAGRKTVVLCCVKVLK